jgi:hypothetical protein
LDPVEIENHIIPMGIEEIKDIVDFFADVKEAYHKIMSDNKVNLMDIPYLFQPAKSLFGAIKGIDVVPYEFKDIDLSEAEDLVGYVMHKFKVNVEGAKEIVSEALKAVIAIKNIIFLVVEE